MKEEISFLTLAGKTLRIPNTMQRSVNSRMYSRYKTLGYTDWVISSIQVDKDEPQFFEVNLEHGWPEDTTAMSYMTNLLLSPQQIKRWLKLFTNNVTA